MYAPSALHLPSIKRFPRWLRGSCIEAPPQTVPGQDEPVKFSFFSDVSMHPEINELGFHVQQSIRRGIQQLVAHANTWKKFKLLWRMQRVRILYVLLTCIYNYTYIYTSSTSHISSCIHLCCMYMYICVCIFVPLY